MNTHTADTILSCTTLYGISAGIFIAAVSASSTVAVAASILVSLGIAGTAWYLDMQVAKNPASLFASDNISRQPATEVKQPSTLKILST